MHVVPKFLRMNMLRNEAFTTIKGDSSKERISIEILHTYKLREETVTSEYDMTQERDQEREKERDK